MMASLRDCLAEESPATPSKHTPPPLIMVSCIADCRLCVCGVCVCCVSVCVCVWCVCVLCECVCCVCVGGGGADLSTVMDYYL